MIESDAWVAKPIGLIFYNIHIVSNQKGVQQHELPRKTAKAQKRARLVTGGACKQDNGLAAGGIKMGAWGFT